MSTFRSVFVFALALFFLPSVASAQLEMKGLEIGPWAGASFYLGDLNTDFKLNRPNIAGGFAARYNFNHRLAARISFNYGRIEAFDSDSSNPFEQNRNLNFQNDIYDGTAQFEFNFLPYFHGHKEFFFTPYAYAGISVFTHSPKTRTDDGQLVELRDFGTEGQMRGDEYLTISGALTYGLGIKWDLSYEISQLAYDLSDRSLILDSEGDRIDRQGQQRGDDSLMDKYIFAGIGFNYYFGDVRCPDYGHKKSRRRRR